MRKCLEDAVRYVKGVGPKRSILLEDLGILTVRDLLDYLPFRIEDFSKVSSIGSLCAGESATVRGAVQSSGFVGSQRGRAFRVAVTDGTGLLYLVWYNAAFMYGALRQGDHVLASGKVEWRRGALEMAHPTFRKIPSHEVAESGPVIPVYHATAGLSSSQIAAIVRNALEEYLPLVDITVPPNLAEGEGLPSEREAYMHVHRPASPSQWHRGMKTFAFREMFYLQLAVQLLRREAKTSKGPGPFLDFGLADRFIRELPFALTRAQEKAVADIRNDLSQNKVMNRLLQGDVGSGKTVVAMYALLAAAGSGFQGAFLAPTEILARQHRTTFQSLAKDLVRVGYLTGAVTGPEREAVLDGLREGRIDILIGTHAMLQGNIVWRKLGVAVTDEQHRFGVKQRLALPEQTEGPSPHVLVMSATPIPRSLALTLYGDLDITVLDVMPEGRMPPETVLLRPANSYRAYRKVREEVFRGHQAYVVCPVIREGKTSRKSAEEAFENLRRGSLKGLRIGLIHGAMARTASEAVMEDFVFGRLDVLVSTTLVEVGVDVPNATCMVVEDAGSFGLATLHQLRGRVGRSRHKAYCFLIAQEEQGRASEERLAALTRITDGFALAEMDLKLRGPGQFFGTRQHGQADLAAALVDCQVSLDLIMRARESAQQALNLMDRGEAGYWGEALLGEVRRKFGDVFSYSMSR